MTGIGKIRSRSSSKEIIRFSVHVQCCNIIYLHVWLQSKVLLISPGVYLKISVEML